MLDSCTCTQEQMESPAFQEWYSQLALPPGRLHRKYWEWCYLCQALSERGMLRDGRRGLGFAVGKEPLTALFARQGCEIVASDLDQAKARDQGWTETDEHANQLDDLNQKDICPPERFRERVKFRVVDMNRLPADLNGFDFVWSSCSFEHLGSIHAGHRFILNMTRCLRPGGVAIHTTEFNVSSNTDTWTSGLSVIFRQLDLLKMKELLESLGHQVAPFNFSTGHGTADQHVDQPPYGQHPHLKLQLGPYVSTSIGIIVTAGEQPNWLRRQWASVRTPPTDTDLRVRIPRGLRRRLARFRTLPT